ncbi:LD-carboxypeptidase [bacterium]|nr:LD-carboxypeptidase [bacterium]MCI0604780.1 LD-carboxypeptidase [bacterium]
MLKPKRLSTGSRVQIVIPASPVRPDFFEPGTEALRRLGLDVHFGSDVYRKLRYLAGSDEERRAELLQALKDSQVDAIFFARGGYGSSRLLTDVREFQDLTPKILLGCSDITSLHLYFQRMHNWIVFHGPMASGDFARGHVHADSFEKALQQTGPYELAPESIEVLIPGKTEGILSGGCLALLEAAVGTPWEPDWNNTILFLEDFAAKPYQIDRMLTHLKLIGKFDGVKAFIFGEMKDCVQTENQGYTLQEVILDLLANFGKPIFYNFPSGHVSAMNWTLPLGVAARVSSEPHFRLSILEGAVL